MYVDAEEGRVFSAVSCDLTLARLPPFDASLLCVCVSKHFYSISPELTPRPLR